MLGASAMSCERLHLGASSHASVSGGTQGLWLGRQICSRGEQQALGTKQGEILYMALPVVLVTIARSGRKGPRELSVE